MKDYGHPDPSQATLPPCLNYALDTVSELDEMPKKWVA